MAEPAAAERIASELPPSQKPEVGAPADSVEVGAARASTAMEPAASGSGIDLNTASVEELNALGAGMIGRRIIAFRPYASPEDLVIRRVLKRGDYEIIKAAVAVR
ncbi:helix-hairpin-helix domain-containing protein [Methylobacterium oxalidis]|uniref:helix-hairpin-helix domain-containing protein n=1 Tax=Methylobacterium oxalidis TaxID=944322 RepID=UPI003315ED8C